MIFSTIFLIASTCLLELLLAVAMSLIPFILGWLAAQAFHNFAQLKETTARLEVDNKELGNRVAHLDSDLTDLRVKHSQTEAELFSKNESLSKAKNDLIIVEAERNNLRIALEEAGGGSKKTAAAPKAAAKASVAVFDFFGTKYKQDDLKIVEGIGPKIEELLHAAGINTWQELANTAVERLREILDAAGSRFQIHDPGSWPKQSQLAHEEKWDDLKKLQDELNAGKE